MDCVDAEGHDYEFIGYMVVSDKLPENPPTTQAVTTTPGTLAGWPLIEVPSMVPAKIEVHQCKKCGEIKLQPAVFTRIMQGDKEDEK